MNIYDIAKEAGVSISTVSRVMNHKGNVNPETRKKVEEILEKNDLHEHNVYAGNSKCVYSNSFCIQYQTGKKECKKYDGTDCCF